MSLWTNYDKRWGEGLAQPWGKTACAYFCLFHEKAQFSASFLLRLKMNAFTSSVATDHALKLCYSMSVKIPHLTKGNYLVEYSVVHCNSQDTFEFLIGKTD